MKSKFPVHINSLIDFETFANLIWDSKFNKFAFSFRFILMV